MNLEKEELLQAKNEEITLLKKRVEQLEVDVESLQFKQYWENKKSNISNHLVVPNEDLNCSLNSQEEEGQKHEDLEEQHNPFPRTSVISMGNLPVANEMVMDEKQNTKILEEFRLLENKYESLLNKFQEHQKESHSALQEKNEEILSLNSKLKESQLVKSQGEIAPTPKLILSPKIVEKMISFEKKIALLDTENNILKELGRKSSARYEESIELLYLIALSHLNY